MTTGLLETYPDVSLDVFQQVAKVNGAVGVGQGTGDQNLALAVYHEKLPVEESVEFKAGYCSR
jgi:hypothetical protein